MKNTIDRNRAAFVAGLSIIIMTLSAIVATDLTIGKLLVAGNATETYSNITSSETIYRIGLLGWLIILITDVIAAWGLYLFFKPVHKGLSQLMALFRLVYVAILAVAIGSLLDVIILIGSLETASATISEQKQVLFCINSFYEIWSFGLILFGIHILLLGYLLLKSADMPKIIGVFLVIGAVGYFLINLFDLLFPQFEEFIKILNWVFILPMLSEVALGILLFIRGLRFKETIK